MTLESELGESCQSLLAKLLYHPVLSGFILPVFVSPKMDPYPPSR